MSSFKYFVVTFVVILLNENLFCNGEPNLFVRSCKRCKRNVPVAGQQLQMVYPGVQQPQYIQTRPVQQPQQAQVHYIQPQQAQVQYLQPQQAQVHYVQPQQAHQVHYVQPQQLQQVEYVQPSTSGLVKPVKPSKQGTNKKVPTTQFVTSNSQPVKYTIPTPTETSQTYSLPQIQSYLTPTYPQAAQIYPQASQVYPQASQIYPQASQIYPQASQIYPPASQIYPQASQNVLYQTPETSYPQGYPVYQTSYPQTSYPQTSYPQQVYPLPETGFQQTYPIPETGFQQSYPSPATAYLQGLPRPVNEYSEIVEGLNYIDSSPKYLLQDTRQSSIYPYGNPNVHMSPRKSTNREEVLKLLDTVNTPQGEIDVELIDVMPYRPGTEPVGVKIPRVNSIEAVVKPQHDESSEDIDEANSIDNIEPTTTKRSSLSLW